MRYVLAVALLVAACGSSLAGGRVIDQKFVPAHSESYQSYEFAYSSYDCGIDYHGHYTCMSNSHYHWVTRWRDIPDEWFVRVEGNCKPTGTSGATTCEQAWMKVDEHTYDSARLGDLPYYGPTPTPG